MKDDKTRIPRDLPAIANTWFSSTNAGSDLRKINPGGKIDFVEYGGSIHPYDVVPADMIDWPSVE